MRKARSGWDDFLRPFLIVFFLLLILPSGIHSSVFSRMKIRNIDFRFFPGDRGLNTDNLRLLINITPGNLYSQEKIRESIKNLFDVGLFEKIEVKAFPVDEDHLDIFFELFIKPKVANIKINFISGINNRELKKAVHSVRENTYFDSGNVSKAVSEIKKFMKSRGYYNALVKHSVVAKKEKVEVIFKIEKGPNVRINRVFVRGDQAGVLSPDDEIYQLDHYVPYTFSEKVEEIEESLKNLGFFFPKIKVSEVFLDNSKTIVNLYIDVEPGFKYSIVIEGINKKFDFVMDIWKKKVFETWAEKESRGRILVYLRNRGFLNAEVTSDIKTRENEKFITFKVVRNDRFVLGKINFEGNRSFSSRVLRDVTSIDDLIFDKLFYLRINSIKVDTEVLKWFYYYKGYPSAKVNARLEFDHRTVNLIYRIDEGEKFIVDSILFRGNNVLGKDFLQSVIKTAPNKPFVQRQLDEDIEKIRNRYFRSGYEKVRIDVEVSSGNEKSILIDINEERHYKFGRLIIIGASRDQRFLLKKLFPMKTGDSFNRTKIESFKNELDRTSIFSDIKISRILKEYIFNVLIVVEQNRSKYLGFGVGYEERTGLRFTFEYQKRNIFRSYSSLSALFQVGLKERRGQVSLETPYLFGTNVNSELRIWEENEFYRSYKFNRYGLSESLVKKLSADSYVLASVSWYRTKLLELNVPGNDIDYVDKPYDITALNISYVKDKRDDPFLPSRGTFFSTDAKLAFPALSSDYSFFRFRWGYQKNARLLKKGIFSFSIRNGFATDNVPITERFFGGGLNTFRGTRNDKLGSLDKDNGEPFGGNSLLLLNFEATFPLYLLPAEGFFYSVFADFGNIYRYSDEFSMSNLQKAIGLGLRYKSPIGLLRFDIAYNIERRESVSPIAIHIGIGNAF